MATLDEATVGDNEAEAGLPKGLPGESGTSRCLESHPMSHRPPTSMMTNLILRPTAL
jgi:hypothetical protein